jgi:hypothetical protein
MSSKYSELFSSLGYDALDVIVGIDARSIPEKKVKKLIQLIVLSEKDENIGYEVKNILETYRDTKGLKLKWLLHLVEQHTQRVKEGGR